MLVDYEIHRLCRKTDMKSIPYIKYCLIALFLFSILFSNNSSADEVRLKGDKVFYGKIVADTEDTVEIETADYGLLSFPRKGVAKVIYKPETPKSGNVASQHPAAQAGEKRPLPRPVGGTADIIAGYDAVVFGISKDVFVRMPEVIEWTSAVDNLQLKVKDEVRTGAGKVKIKLRGRGELRLPPDSHFVLAAMDEKAEKVTVELKSGRIWNNITPGSGLIDYTVKTPDLVAGVRGTLFKVSLNESPKARVAVFSGSVYTIGAAGGAEVILSANKSISTDSSGNLTETKTVGEDEIKEWTEWDAWAEEVHREVASHFLIGRMEIDAVAKNVAEDGKRYDAIMSEANQTILTNREADRLDEYKEAFFKFAKDTGIFPTNEMGFSILIEDPGLPGWKGPYISEKTLPILDRWGGKIRYSLKKAPNSGNIFGEIHSDGPDRIDSGDSTGDDLRSIIPYYQLGFSQ